MTADIFQSKIHVGVIGRIDPVLANKLELPENVCLAELDLDTILASRAPRKFSGRLQFPGSVRDLSILVAGEIPAADLVSEIERGSRLVADVTIFDLYQGEPVPAGWKSLAFSIHFRSAERTLRDEEVDQAFNRILNALIKKFDVKLR